MAQKPGKTRPDPINQPQTAMTFTPPANLTFIKQFPTLNELNGTFKDATGTQCMWALRLNVDDERKKQLIEQAKKDGIVDRLPTFSGDLNAISNRVHAVTQRMRGLVPHGWSATLVRSDPNTSGGTIEPKQLYVSQERIKIPGTEKALPARVTVLFETELNADKTLSKPKEAGTVISYELDDTLMLHRKMEVIQDGAGVSPDAAANQNKGRLLFISAHAVEPTEPNGESRTMPLPDDITFSYAVPSGYFSGGTTPVGESEFAKLAKDFPRFAAIKKTGKDSELAAFPHTDKLNALLNNGGGLSNAAYDAKGLFTLAAGTPRAGHVADSLLKKFGQVRNAPDLPATNSRPAIPSIVHTRSCETYDQVAFGALNDKKVDILTIRAGKKLHKGELVDTLKKHCIYSQYNEIYDPSCRTPPTASSMPPRWIALEDNVPIDRELGFLKRTGSSGGTAKITVVDDSDKDARDLKEQFDTLRQGQSEATANAAHQEAGSSSPPEIPLV
jgi:hypothetical protein